MSPASQRNKKKKKLFWHISIYHKLQGPVWAHLDKLFAIAAPQGMKMQGKLNRDSTLSSSCPTSATEAFTVINKLRNCIKQLRSHLQSCIKIFNLQKMYSPSSLRPSRMQFKLLNRNDGFVYQKYATFLLQRILTDGLESRELL